MRKPFDKVADALAPTIQAINGRGGSSHYGGRSGGAGWDFGLSASTNNLILDHHALRQNARDACHDSSHARAVVSRMADSIAGSGIILEPAPKTELLGISIEEGEKWAEDVASRFDLFAGDKKQHRSEQMNLYQASRFYEINNHRDGEVFARLFYSKDSELLNPLQIEFLDPNQIRGDAFTSIAGPYGQEDGIIRDSRGREKAYKIWVRNENGKYKFVKIPAKGAKSKRIFMLHGFAPEFPGQTRGFSRLSHALQEFENITDFTSAQIKKAINQSNITMYTKPSPNNPASNPLEGILNAHGGAGPIVEQFGASPNPSATAQSVTDDSVRPVVNYTPMPEATMSTPGSVGVFNLEEGEDLQPFKNTAPSEGYNVFIDSFVSHLSASFSMPIEVLLMKFNSNYSASRGALLLFWKVAEIWRHEQISDFLDPIYSMWMSEEIARGTITAPGWSNPVLRAAWLNSRWIGPAMPNIDPLKTMSADKGYIEIGATTQDRVARDYNGSSGKTNRAINTRTYKETPESPWSRKKGA